MFSGIFFHVLSFDLGISKQHGFLFVVFVFFFYFFPEHYSAVLCQSEIGEVGEGLKLYLNCLICNRGAKQRG